VVKFTDVKPEPELSVNEDDFKINKVPDHVSVHDMNNDDDVPNVTVKPDDETVGDSVKDKDDAGLPKPPTVKVDTQEGSMNYQVILKIMHLMTVLSHPLTIVVDCRLYPKHIRKQCRLLRRLSGRKPWKMK